MIRVVCYLHACNRSSFASLVCHVHSRVNPARERGVAAEQAGYFMLLWCGKMNESKSLAICERSELQNQL